MFLQREDEGGRKMLHGKQKQLLDVIYAASFALNDIVLYLDTHPTEQPALEYYEYYKNLRREALQEYSELYGPLLADQVKMGDNWNWVKTPWPWEGEC